MGRFEALVIHILMIVILTNTNLEGKSVRVQHVCDWVGIPAHTRQRARHGLAPTLSDQVRPHPSRLGRI